MKLFQECIRNWEDWKTISGKLTAFEEIVKQIFHKEGIPISAIQEMPPSTNAVFRAGAYVIKIYAPWEAQMDPKDELRIECFAMRRARETGVAVPNIMAWGYIEDRYKFFYLISRYIEGCSFTEAVAGMEDIEKVKTGERLRKLTSRMNVPCAPFRQTDLLTDPDRQVRWQSYETSFQEDRRAYLSGHCLGEPVFVHGDLNGQNIRVDDAGTIWILDFAEAVSAPVVYEQMYVAVELFQLDAALMEGYFQGLPLEMVAQLITEGLLIHDFGGDLVRRYFDGSDGLYTTGELKERVRKKLVFHGYSKGRY